MTLVKIGENIEGDGISWKYTFVAFRDLRRRWLINRCRGITN